jgi:hypothetical protein
LISDKIMKKHRRLKIIPKDIYPLLWHSRNSCRFCCVAIIG